jgi:hypothetical protein
LNSLAAVYYENDQNTSIEDTKAMYFEMYEEIGLNIGKFLRLSVTYLDADEF